MAEGEIDFEQAEAMGVSHEAYDEVVSLVGHIPTMDELATLLSMWESNGRQQSLYGWLKGQWHATVRDDYLYSGTTDHRAIQEPRTKECLTIAQQLCRSGSIVPLGNALGTGMLLYMVGNISTEFADGEYARRCLHIVVEPTASASNTTDSHYVALIADALLAKGIVDSQAEVSHGGLFCSLLRFTAPLGFDILCPREVRLDAFLFGEEQGRRIVALEEGNDDAFLLKLSEARLNCCFLGRTTKGRIVVDGYDFGPAVEYLAQ